MSGFKSSVYGVIAGLTVISLCTLVGAIAYLHYDYDPYFILLIMQLAYCSGAFSGGFITSRLYGRNGIISGLIVSLALAVICIASNLFFGERYITMQLIITVTIMIGAGMSGGVLSLNVGKNKTV